MCAGYRRPPGLPTEAQARRGREEMAGETEGAGPKERAAVQCARRAGSPGAACSSPLTLPACRPHHARMQFYCSHLSAAAGWCIFSGLCPEEGAPRAGSARVLRPWHAAALRRERTAVEQHPYHSSDQMTQRARVVVPCAHKMPLPPALEQSAPLRTALVSAAAPARRPSSRNAARTGRRCLRPASSQSRQ